MDQRPGQLPFPGKILEWLLHLYAENSSTCQLAKNEDIYAGLECVSDKIMKRRLRLAGHSVRQPELGANPLVLWEPTQGTPAR